MGAGRFVCVALPLILTLGSIGTLLYAVLAGVTHESVHLFRLNVTDLSISPASIENIVNRGLNLDLDARAETLTENITAADLGLANIYDVTLWGYCTTSSDNKRNCTKSQFNWASKDLNTTKLETQQGVAIQLPSSIEDALNTFSTITKWAEIAFIIALIALGVELLLGVFSNFSRAISCVTWLVSGISMFLVVAAASLATAMAVVVVAAVESTAKFYGVNASLDTTFLAVIWISVAFACASSLFWIFTICCCKPEHRRKSRETRSVGADGEKLLPTGAVAPGGYAPLGSEHEMTSGNYYNPNQPRFGSGAGSGRSDLAYEPYSHRV